LKLRIPEGGTAPGCATRAPMLSPDGARWCLLDSGGGVPGAPQPTPHAVVLTGMHKDQVGGLLDLRGGAPIDLYATAAVFEHLTHTLPLLTVLQQYCGLKWHLIDVAGDRRDASFNIVGWPTLHFTAMSWGPGPTGERIALAVRDERTAGRLLVSSVDAATGVGAVVNDWMQDADCLLLSGASPQRGEAPGQWLDDIAALPTPRKILRHFAPETAAPAALAARGIQSARGGVEIEL
jgi:pyrroloquinoline quinone biosynthesis protein B